MTFTFLNNQPKVPGVQDLWFEVLKMLSAIEALQKGQDVHSTLSNNTKMQFLNLPIIIFCLYYCNCLCYGNIQSDTVDWFYYTCLGRLSRVIVTEPYALYTLTK